MVFELVGGVEYAAAIVGAHDGEFPVLAEVGGGDQFGFAVHFVPYCDLEGKCI